MTARSTAGQPEDGGGFASVRDDPLALRLEVLRAIDDLFDECRDSTIEVLAERVFSILKERIPTCEYFLAMRWPQYEADREVDRVSMTHRLFVSSGDISGQISSMLDRVGLVPMSGNLVHEGSVLLVPLRGRRGFLGWLGALPRAADGNPPLPPMVELLLASAAQRLDSECHIYSSHLVRRAVSAKVSRRLEDYYVERGIRKATDVMIANELCTGVYICYERAVDEGNTDVASFLHTESGTVELPIAALEWPEDQELPLPAAVRERVASYGDSYRRPLIRRGFDGELRPFGCLVFIGRSFGASDKLFFDELAVAFDSVLINYHEKRRELGRFLSPTLARRLLQGDRHEIEEHLAPQQRWLALGFADIVRYSRLCSQYSDRPHDLAKLLKDWKRAMRSIVFRHDAIVDKFIGDCVFYQCGAWSTAPHEQLALDAVQIALALVDETERIGSRLAEYGFDRAAPLKLSVGIHMGDNLVVGDVGGEFTAIGADVNIAQRIQDDEFASGQIVVSQAVRRKLEPLLDRLDRPGRKVRFGKPQTLTLKGIGEIEVFPVHKFPGTV